MFLTTFNTPNTHVSLPLLPPFLSDEEESRDSAPKRKKLVKSQVVCEYQRNITHYLNAIFHRIKLICSQWQLGKFNGGCDNQRDKWPRFSTNLMPRDAANLFCGLRSMLAIWFCLTWITPHGKVSNEHFTFRLHETKNLIPLVPLKLTYICITFITSGENLILIRNICHCIYRISSNNSPFFKNT